MKQLFNVILLCLLSGSNAVKLSAKDYYGQFKFEVNLVQKGNEARKCQTGEVAVVNYTGRLVSDGTVFDSSEEKGQPFSFVLGQAEVIECWDEGFK